jgi:hypothetical protein
MLRARAYGRAHHLKRNRLAAVQKGAQTGLERDRALQRDVAGRGEPGSAQILAGSEQCERLAQDGRVPSLLGIDDAVARSARTRRHVDRRKEAAPRQGARQHDVPVERRARRDADRVALVVGIGQNGCDQRHRAACAIAGRFEVAIEFGPDARRITAAAGRLAQPVGPLTQRRRIARQTVDDQQHVQASLAQVGRLRHRDFRGAHPLARRPVGGSADDRRVRRAAFDPTLRLAPAFADQRDHDRIGLRAAQDHLEQRRLARAGSTEDADTRAASERQEAVDRGDAGFEARVDGQPFDRRRDFETYRAPQTAGRRAPVERRTAGVDRAAQ